MFFVRDGGRSPIPVLAQRNCSTSHFVLLRTALMQDIMAVRTSMIDAAGAAWSGFRAAAVECFEHSYGEQAAETVGDSCDVVGELASLSVSMKLTPAAGW
jgi:hypothetical protein